MTGAHLGLRTVIFSLAFAALVGAASPVEAGWVVLFGKNGYEASSDLPKEVAAALAKVKRGGKELRCVAFTPTGGWVVLSGKNEVASKDIPEGAEKELEKFARAGKTIRSVSFGDKGSWAIVCDENTYSTHDVGPELEKKLAEVLAKNKPINSLSLTTGNYWAITYDNNWWYTWNASDELFRTMGNVVDDKSAFRNCIVGPKGSWVVLHGKQEMLIGGDVPADAVKALQAASKKGLHSATFFELPGEGASTSSSSQK